ncbi:ankyrin repeat-containing domain protein [Emericellopsis atlantica]|uniref:Ankyrin repeat-containing domain protein n=1 Tax=Emericellopsis atlantica TaxID=2614577 RepID=A0A9P7ZJS0_9HYPO|nr:ankyrin repeat-containing domain protein [Emericellopsis atlantica]KAG9252996.1 ankyrin repeat-containing domain protein [Emericellopsis atlantica]
MSSAPSLETLPNELLHKIVAYAYDPPPEPWINEHDSLLDTLVGDGYIGASDKWRLPSNLGYGGFCRVWHLQNLALISRRFYSFLTPLIYGFFSDCDHCLRPWEHAAETDQPEIILQWRKCHPDAPIAGSAASKSALSKAIARNSIRVAELLLYEGYTFKNDTVHVAPDLASPYPLLQAAARGHLHIVKLIADRGDDLNCGDFFSPGYQRQRYKVTALWQAVRHGHEDVIKFLLSRGAQWQPRGSQPHGPLWSALKYGRASIVRLFAELGLHDGLHEDAEAIMPFAHLNVGKYSQGQQWLLRRVLDLTSSAHRDQLHEQLRKHNIVYDENNNVDAFEEGYSMEEACFFGADLDAPMRSDLSMRKVSGIDRRPLVQAFSMPNRMALSMVSTLLEHNADPNIRPRGSQRTILHDAVLLANYDEAYKISLALISAGASLEATAYTGMTPLLWACLGHAHPEIIQLLIGSNANTYTNITDGSALYWALTDWESKGALFLWRNTNGDAGKTPYPALARRFLRVKEDLVKESAGVVQRGSFWTKGYSEFLDVNAVFPPEVDADYTYRLRRLPWKGLTKRGLGR